jgi:hypothetical protein
MPSFRCQIRDAPLREGPRTASVAGRCSSTFAHLASSVELLRAWPLGATGAVCLQASSDVSPCGQDLARAYTSVGRKGGKVMALCKPARSPEDHAPGGWPLRQHACEVRPA